MSTVDCTRCNESKASLSEPPMGGELGNTVVERICEECWTEWRETSAKLINHYGLNLGEPAHRQQLRRAMKEFLSLDGDDS